MNVRRAICLTSWLALCCIGTQSAAAVTDAEATALAAQVVASLKSTPNIERIEIDRASARNFTYTIWYKTQPTLGSVKNDTTALVRSTLKKLVAAGINTKDDLVFIYAHAYKRQKGETRDMVRDYAKASYNFNTDSIEFKISK